MKKLNLTKEEAVNLWHKLAKSRKVKWMKRGLFSDIEGFTISLENDIKIKMRLDWDRYYGYSLVVNELSFRISPSIYKDLRAYKISATESAKLTYKDLTNP